MNAKHVGLVAALVLGASLVTHAADWPQWRGPQRHGVSTETGLLKEWPAAGPALRWQVTDVGDGYSSMAVVGDRLYTLANLELDNEFVRAMAVQDGKTLWTTRLGRSTRPRWKRRGPTRSSPMVVCMSAIAERSGRTTWRSQRPAARRASVADVSSRPAETGDDVEHG